MVQTPTKSLTLDEFLLLPDTKPASEYIDGEVIQKPMPQGEHSTLQGELVIVINGILRPETVGRAYPELRCTFGGRSIVPDVAVFRTERIPRKPDGRVENVFDIPPDWTIEILSPGQSQSKVIRNILHCINHGTEMGWLLDSEEPCIFVYGAKGTVRVFDQPETIVPIPEFAGAIQLTVGEIFGWLSA
jgi:Uma2 family endonuclease